MNAQIRKFKQEIANSDFNINYKYLHGQQKYVDKKHQHNEKALYKEKILRNEMML